MDDEDLLALLRDSTGLRQLLHHYAAVIELEAWQDRLMELDGATVKDLVMWHGTLLASGWLQQNTGAVPAVRPGAVLGCYRATRAGRQALQAAQEPAEAA